MPRDHRLYLDDILEAIGNTREYLTGLGYGAFSRDKKNRDAGWSETSKSSAKRRKKSDS